MCTSYENFETVFLEVLEIHAPLKKKYIRENEVPYMTNALKKAIMKRSKLESRFYRTKSELDKIEYKKQKNYVSRLYKREVKRFYQRLDTKQLIDNKTFWKNVKPLFSDKSVNSHKITLVEGKEIISNDVNVAETLNTYFRDAVTSLDIKMNTDLLNTVVTNEQGDDIDNIIEEFAAHPSILKINEMVVPDTFYFSEVDLEDIGKEIVKLNPKKATTFKNIPTKLIKQNKGYMHSNITQTSELFNNK